jgi:hypothetical protein
MQRDNVPRIVARCNIMRCFKEPQVFMKSELLVSYEKKNITLETNDITICRYYFHICNSYIAKDTQKNSTN